jgi:RNA polymerase sigma-70 factor (ECF subfamily)
MGQMHHRTDSELWRQAGDGNGDAFGVIFDRYARTVYNFCFRRTGSWDRAEDLVADVFLEAWRKRDALSLTPSQRLLPWLLGVAQNKIRNESRAITRSASLVARLRPRPVPDFANDSLARMADEQLMAEILHALRDLPADELDMLTTFAWGGLEYAEVAELFDIPIGTVRSRISRCREHLRKMGYLIEHPATERQNERKLRNEGAASST